MCVGIAEDETDGREEITFAGTIATNDHIVLGRKRLDDRLVLVAKRCSKSVIAQIKKDNAHSPLEALDNNLLNVHLDEARDAKSTLITTKASRDVAIEYESLSRINTNKAGYRCVAAVS